MGKVEIVITLHHITLHYLRSSDSCRYRINAPGGQVLLTFVTFSTESCCDCLSVYDGKSQVKIQIYISNIQLLSDLHRDAIFALFEF